MKTDADKLRSFIKQVAPESETYGNKGMIAKLADAIAGVEESVSVLFCGEFKRGKSSLVNAIIGCNLCPVDIGIATSVVTIVRYGAVRKAVRYYGNLLDEPDSLKSEEIEWDDIARYTMGDVLDIDNTILVELSYPSQFLKGGITIVDTPGIGGLDPRHAVLTHMTLPKADVIVFVTDAGEPLTQSELDFYENKILPCGKRTVVLVNKSDVLSRETLENHINKTRLELARFDSPEVIHVSSRCWELYSSLQDNDLLLSSNKDAVLAGIIEAVEEYRKREYRKYRDILINEMENISAAISMEISQLQKDAEDKAKEIDSLICQFSSLTQYRKDLETPTSQTRMHINSLFEDARNEVMSLISTRGGELTSVEFEDLLSSESGLDNDGKWLIVQVNERIASLSEEVDKGIESAFKDISDKIQCNIIDVAGGGSFEMSDEFKMIDAFTSQMLFSTLGKAGLSFGVVSVIASGPVGWVIGLATAAGLLWNSLVNENDARKKSEIKQQLLPKINLALTEMRNQVTVRFTKFHQNLLMALQSIIAETEEKMRKLQKSIQESRVCENQGRDKIAELEKKLKYCETIISQMKLLYSNPFSDAK